MKFLVYHQRGDVNLIDTVENKFAPVVDGGALMFFEFGKARRGYAKGTWSSFEIIE